MRFMIREVFTFIDKHNDTGVNADMLYEAGLFARKGDASSWLSRWKSKGYLRTEKDNNYDNGSSPIKPRLRYFTIVDGSRRDWSTLIDLSNQQIHEMRETEHRQHVNT